jgi:AcrR family transcriptional regulator
MNPQFDMRSHILSTAKTLFLQFGFSKVTVDEIASRLGISKKTIYKYFTSKDELINTLLEQTISEMDAQCKGILQREDLGFVEKLREMMKNIAVQYSALHRPLMEDLERNAPHIWRRIAEFRSTLVHQGFGKLLREGIEQGMFRDDIDEKLILMIYLNAIESSINPQSLASLPFSAVQVYEAILKVIYEGILTSEARLRIGRQSILSVAQQRI